LTQRSQKKKGRRGADLYYRTLQTPGGENCLKKTVVGGDERYGGEWQGQSANDKNYSNKIRAVATTEGDPNNGERFTEGRGRCVKGTALKKTLLKKKKKNATTKTSPKTGRKPGWEKRTGGVGEGRETHLNRVGGKLHCLEERN